MDQETIENHIKSLGKRDFDALVGVVLTKFFNLTAIDVDGKGDGGSDYRVFSDARSTRTLAIQRTVQESQWDKKAFDDARKAVTELKASRYFFLTSRAHESSTLLAVEDRINSELKIPAKCLGATELAGIILEQGLLRDFASAIGLQIDIQIADRPDKTEVLLHAYAALGADRSDLRNEIYDDTLLLTLHASKSPLARKELLNNASSLIEASPLTQDKLTRRVDSLLTRGLIEKNQEGHLRLSDAIKLQLSVADGLYDKELQQLASAQSQLIHELCGLDWTDQQCVTAATLLSRWFVQRQLIAAEHASIPIARMGWSRTIGDPEIELRQLLSVAGVSANKVPLVLSEFVDLASDMPLVSKLARAVTYVATEGTDMLRASRALGASSWAEIAVTLDASVAIPFLCSSMFAPTSGRFSQGANTCITHLRNNSAKLVIPWVYIEEVAAHLLRALDYPEITEIPGALEQSRNGFVAHYHQLKAAHVPVPSTIRAFVSQFSKAAVVRRSSPQETIRSIMANLQPLLADHGVKFDDISNIPDHFRKDVETAFVFRMNELNRVKSQRLVEHDVKVLSHARRSLSERHEKRLCLTWDAVMIAVGKEIGDCGLILSPHEAADIVQPRVRMSGSKLTALAHSLARVRERPSELGARIIDRIVQLASERFQDWQFRERLRMFYDDALTKLDLTSNSYSDVDREIDGFLEREGISKQPSDVESSE